MDNDQTLSLCLYVALFCEHLLEDCQPPSERYFQHIYDANINIILGFFASGFWSLFLVIKSLQSM